ncbi:30S ribosomal protein S1 [bacterium HR23]|nr:30S ribosomal protein S1 [bacterium HR23]
MSSPGQSVPTDPSPESMADLLSQSDSWRPLRRGEVVEGLVMRVYPDGLLVSVGGKSEGFVPLREMRTLADKPVKVGDTILATVLRPEGEEGPALLSVDRAHGEKGWRLLENALAEGRKISARCIGYNRGGLLVDVEGVQGFIPLSQVAPVPRPPQGEGDLAQRVGATLHLKVLEVERKRGRAILSERAVWHEEREAQKERLLQELREGEVRRGRVSSLSPFGAFVDLGGADGLIHLSELSWTRVERPEEVLQVGQEVEVYVLKVDREHRRISLSLRRLLPQPWETAVHRYQVGQLVQATITRLTEFGAFARLEGGIEGLIHISELAERPLTDPRQAVREGETVTVKILRIEPERRRISLSLRQAQAELAL